MKILIAVPCMDQVPAQFAQSLATLQKVDQTVVAFQIGSLVYHSRNDLSKMAVKYDVDFVLWLDSDMMIQADALVRLLKDYNEGAGDILTGVYFRRMHPFSPVLYKKLQFAEYGAVTEEFDEIPEGLFEVEGCGFGCVLMPSEVIFDIMAKYGNPFDPLGGCGEDLSFCWRARELGYKIICDPSIQLGHVGHHVITREYWEDYRKLK